MHNKHEKNQRYISYCRPVVQCRGGSRTLVWGAVGWPQFQMGGTCPPVAWRNNCI